MLSVHKINKRNQLEGIYVKNIEVCWSPFFAIITVNLSIIDICFFCLCILKVGS